MALGNKKASAAGAQGESTGKPAFEDEGGTATVQQDTKQDTKPAETPAASPAAQPDAAAAATVTSTAIAKASSSAVAQADAAASAKAFQRELDAMEAASDFSFGNYRVFKADQGEITETGGDKESLGRWAKVHLMAWDRHFEVSPGEKGASTKDFVAYSKDGKVIDSVIGEEQKSWVGKDVAEYLEYLRTEEEFENAKCREFIDCGCALLGTESGEGPVNSVIQITLASSSISAFNRYQNSLKDAARAVSMGIPGFKVPENPFQFFFLREAASKGDNNWTKLKIVQELPAKL